MKKFLLALCLLMGYATLHAATETVDGITWTYTVSNGEASITKWPKSTSGAITIPSTLGGYSVTSIGDSAFFECYYLTSVTIPSSVTSIGNSAFACCSDLTSVTIPSSVTSIGDHAFQSCSSLTSITIPEGVTSIGSYAFRYCESLTSVTLPSSLTSIGISPFYYCPSLTSVTIPEGVLAIVKNAFSGIAPTTLTAAYLPNGMSKNNLKTVIIPEGVTSIKTSAFSGCSGLTSVTIPSSVTTIGESAFSDCSSLTSVTIPSSVTSIGDEAFQSCSSLTSVTILEGVTSVGDSAFRYCESLTSVTIPSSVTSIGVGAFASCSNLPKDENGVQYESAAKVVLIDVPTSIKGEFVIPNTVRFIHSNAFSDCSGLTSITLPSSVTSIGVWAFAGCSNLPKDENGVQYESAAKVVLIDVPTSMKGEFVIPNTVRFIHSYAFSGCSGLTSITIPSSVTTLGDYAFYYCTSLTSVTLSEGVTTIGEHAFYGCSSLTSVTIPEGVTSIGYSPFYGCSSLTSVTIPSSVTTIVERTFEFCKGLTSVTISEGVTSIGGRAFANCSNLTSVTIPSSVTSIGDYAFAGCSLTSVTIPEGVLSIGEATFYLCSSLTSVTIPSSVTSIGVGAFQNCSSLTSVTIPSSVTSIGDYAFRYCKGLTSVTISEGVTSIGWGAFDGCSGLTSVTIPSSVTSIGSYAFFDCSGLTSVTILEGVTSIGGDAFRSCSGLTSVTIPEGVTSIGDSAFQSCSSLTSVTIPSSVTSIGVSAFSGCSSLTSVTIPSGVTSIGDYAFYGCSSLTSVTIPASVTSIGSYAFSGVAPETLTAVEKPSGGMSFNNLKTVIIPEGVTSIGDSAFSGCSNLTSVTLPSSVTSIGDDAFYNCSSLTSVVFKGEPPQNLELLIADLPKSVKFIYTLIYFWQWQEIIQGLEDEELCSNVVMAEMEGVVFHYEEILATTSWEVEKEHWILRDVVVKANGGALTIAPGTVVKFMPGTRLIVEEGATVVATNVTFTHMYDRDVGLNLGSFSETCHPQCYDYQIEGELVTNEETLFRYYDFNQPFYLGVLREDTTFEEGKVYIVSNRLTLPSGVTLTIEPGAIVKFMPKASLVVNNGGVCIAQGAIFTHINDDAIGGDTLKDGGATLPVMGEYTFSGNITDDETTEYYYLPPQELPSDVTSDTSLRGNCVYVVSSPITVSNNATLTIQPGAILKFKSEGRITVNNGALLNAIGTRTAPIVFTSIKDDAIGGDTNGDGNKTLPQPGDWMGIWVYGSASFNYSHIYYNSSKENYGGLEAYGGRITFDNSEIAHTRYECVNAHSGGAFVANNSIFRDAPLAFGYYGSGKVKAYNCVFSDLTVAIRQSGKELINCVFYKCFESFTDQGGDGSTFKNCLFYNPPAYGPQAYDKVGQDGNIWGDPLFVDPMNGDFRVVEGSPSVDAADSRVAPEVDYYGRPRMDVKRVKDTGVANEEGICADIGIYELSGTSVTPLLDLDLAVLSIATAETVTSGESITLTYTVKNCGQADVVGIIQDKIYFRGAEASLGGQVVEGESIARIYSLKVGEVCEVTQTFTVPPLKAGLWEIGIGVNARRDIFEQNLSNNEFWHEFPLQVLLDALALGQHELELKAKEAISFELTQLPLSGGTLLIKGGTESTFVYGGNGALPLATTDSKEVGQGSTMPISTYLSDGTVLVVFPPRVEGKRAYALIENRGDESVNISLEVQEPKLALYDVSPTRIGNGGEATLVLTGTQLSSVLEVRIGDLKAHRIDVINIAQIAATFNVDGRAAGSYDISVKNEKGEIKCSQAVEVYAVKMGPKLSAWLELPESIRDGRVSVGYVCYANDGDSSMKMPVFKVTATSENTKLGLSLNAQLSETVLRIGGISSTYPAGILKAGEEARIPFYFQTIDTYQIQLSHINDQENNDQENLEAYPSFGGTQAYLEAMSSVATRLNLRGKREYDIATLTEFALSEKQNRVRAAVSGYLVDEKTGEPLAHENISLVMADMTQSCTPATGITDEKGYFQLAPLADGEYRWLLDANTCLATESANTVTILNQADLNDVTVCATPSGHISGFVFTESGEPLTSCVVSLLSQNNNSVITAVLTDAAGAFTFKNLTNGEYCVRSMPIDGYSSAVVEHLVIDEITRKINTSITVKQGAVIKGVVTFNGDLVTTGTVEAITESGNSIQTTCDENGEYAFNGIEPGSYAIRYFSNTLVSDDMWVDVKVGDDITQNLTTSKRSLFEPSTSLGYGTCTVTFYFVDQKRAKEVTAWAWDFESDGVIDSYEQTPTWTYTSIGVNSVTLTITEPQGQTTHVYPECVTVEAMRETILADGAIIFGENSGTLQIVSREIGSLVLTGSPESGTIEVGNVILGFINEGMFCCRVESVKQSGDTWTLTTSDTTWDEAYEQCTISTRCAVVADDGGSQASLFSNTSARGKRDGDDDDGPFKLYASGGLDISASIEKDLYFEYSRSKVEGKVTERFALVGSYKVGVEATLQGEVGANFGKEIEVVKIPLPTTLPGVTVNTGVTTFWNGNAHINGSLTANASAGAMLRIGATWSKGEKLKWLKPFEFEGSASTEGNVEGALNFAWGTKVYVEPRLWCFSSVEAGCNLQMEVQITANSHAPASAGVYLAPSIYGEANLVDLNWKIFECKVGVSGEIELPKLTLVEWTTPNPDFEYPPTDNLRSPLIVQFSDKSEGGKLCILDKPFVADITDYEWDFGNGMMSNLQNPSTIYEQDGTYIVSLKVMGDGIDGPYRKKEKIKIGKIDDPNGGGPIDSKAGTTQQSWDPNEIVGPQGIAEKRYVQPGEWMTYTIYFENKEGFNIADAQEVTVTNPLSQYLDWSTFEMGEIAFNNQIDLGLNHKKSGTSEVKIKDSDKFVQTKVTVDTHTGLVKWYMRVYDPNGLLGWPNDGSGFLPSNDETHRGEGHLTYRVKVRADAPADVQIDNSATIVFDYNDPIETEPAWWNTVAPFFTQVFDANGGEGDTSVMLRCGSELVPPQFTREGYTFMGWSPEVPKTVPAQNMTYVAQWQVNQFTSTFKLYDGAQDVVKTQDYGSALTAPTVTREGYTLTGWSPAVPKTVPAMNATYTAQWKVNPYTMTFNANGGVGGKTVTQNYASALAAPTVTREGHTFTGWSPAVPKTVPAKNMTYTAQWKVNPYTMTFNANGGVGGKTVTQNYGSALDAPKVTREGYTFTGWSPAVPATVPATNATYTAQWKANQYAATFKLYDGAQDVVLKQDYATALTAPTVTREGYTFVGWLDQDGKSVQVPETVPNANVTYTAQWKVNQYTATFKLYDGAKDIVKTQDYGSALTAPTVTRTGYTFTGWSPAVPATVPAKDTTYVAQWKKNAVTPTLYTITFNANGGTGGKTVKQAAGTTLTAPTVTRTGYTFTGWSPAVPKTVPAKNMTYTAQWKVNQYTMTFNANGGVGGKTVTQNYGSALAAPTVTREGYTFTGWSPAVPKTVPATNATYTAQWKANATTGEETLTKVDVALLSYTTKKDQATITGCKSSNSGWLDIPSKIGNATVVAIANGAFKGQKNLKKVTLPNTITSIGKDAFVGCSNLDVNAIVMPNQAKLKVGKGAFTGCKVTEVSAVPGEPLTSKQLGKAVGYKAATTVSGLKVNAKTGDITATFKKSGTYEAVLFKPGATLKAIRIKVGEMPKLTIKMEGANTGCSVKGEGSYLMGKKVSISAKASKEKIFVGFYENGKELTKDMKYSFVMGRENRTLTAKFKEEVITINTSALTSKTWKVGETVNVTIPVTAESGVKSVKAAKLPSGLKLSKTKDNCWQVTGSPKKEGNYTVTFTVGTVQKKQKTVTITMKVIAETVTINTSAVKNKTLNVGQAASGLTIGATATSGIKSVKASKLPSGMKVQLVNGTWQLTGEPKKAGTYTVTLTITTKANTKVTEIFTLTVALIPEWAVKTFSGEVVNVWEEDDGEVEMYGYAQITVLATGEVKGRVSLNDGAFATLSGTAKLLESTTTKVRLQVTVPWFDAYGKADGKVKTELVIQKTGQVVTLNYLDIAKDSSVTGTLY